MVPKRNMKMLKRLKLTHYEETVIDNSLLGKGQEQSEYSPRIVIRDINMYKQ